MVEEEMMPFSDIIGTADETEAEVLVPLMFFHTYLEEGLSLRDLSAKYPQLGSHSYLGTEINHAKKILRSVLPIWTFMISPLCKKQKISFAEFLPESFVKLYVQGTDSKQPEVKTDG